MFHTVDFMPQSCKSKGIPVLDDVRNYDGPNEIHFKTHQYMNRLDGLHRPPTGIYTLYSLHGRILEPSLAILLNNFNL